MKKLFLVFAIVALAVTSSFAQKGEKSVGLKLNYGEYISNFGLGAQFTYNVTDAIRIAPSFNYFFKNDYRSAFDVDIDAHYLFPFADKFAAYPIGGLTYQSWKFDFLDDNTSKSYSRFGLNAGGGIQYNINSDWRAFAEAKYAIVSDYNQFTMSIGIAFVFN